MKEVAFYNDNFVDINDNVIPIQERGHQFGDGVYEVIRVYYGKPFLLKEHLDRLERSASAIELKLPFPRTKIIEIIEEGLKRSNISEAEIYFQITRGIAPRQHHFPNISSTFSMTIRSAKKVDDQERKEGINVLLLDDVRWLNCYIKSLNLLPNVMAKQKAIANQCREAILVRNGIVTEGSSSNVFVFKNGILYTHPATNRILHGITRAKVIQLAKQQNINVKEQEFDVQFLQSANEVFITSTSVELLPVKKINDARLPIDRPKTNKLYEEYKKLYTY
ncbi:D-amino-acid transaminase [Anaerobacillus sp. MEB173]|uniref:D-amino-acid transaminase n=1 Tax=Anaerobacillus sp. MEB173 TaxID=3383345 RepID=UPI003F8E3D1E